MLVSTWLPVAIATCVNIYYKTSLHNCLLTLNTFCIKPITNQLHSQITVSILVSGLRLIVEKHYVFLEGRVPPLDQRIQDIHTVPKSKSRFLKGISRITQYLYPLNQSTRSYIFLTLLIIAYCDNFQSYAYLSMRAHW